MEISTNWNAECRWGRGKSSVQRGPWLRPNLRPLESKDEEKPTGVILSGGIRGKSSWAAMRVTKGKLGFVLAHEMPDNAIQVGQSRECCGGRWNHVWATYEARERRGSHAVCRWTTAELAVGKDSLQGARIAARSGVWPHVSGRGSIAPICLPGFPVLPSALSRGAAALPCRGLLAEIVQKPVRLVGGRISYG